MRTSCVRALSFSSLVLLACFFEGCMEFGRLDYTRPVTAGTNSAESIHSFRYPEVFPVPVEAPNLELAVAPSADSTTYLFCPFPCPLPLIPWLPGIIDSWLRPTDYEPDQPLWLEFWIIPTGGEISLDARKVILRTFEGKELTSAGQEGPSILVARETDRQTSLSNSSHSCSLLLRLGSQDLRGKVSEREIIITKPACLRLAFRLSAVPSRSYFLQVGGLSREGVPIRMAPIQFERTTRKALWRLF
jgi:hypothetical protein